MASIYKRGKTWWLIYYRDGKKVQKSLKTRDQKTAEFKQKEHEVALTKGTLPHLKRAPLADVQKEYDEYCTANKTKTTVSRDKSVLKRFLDWAQPGSIEGLTHSKVEDYVVLLRKQKKAPKTVNRFLEVIRAFCNWAVQKGYLAQNPATSVKKLRVPKDPPRFLTKEEAERLLKAAEDSSLLPMIATGIYAGMRLASRLVQEGVSIYKVSQWLGHSSVQTTMIYAHLMPERDADIDRM